MQVTAQGPGGQYPESVGGYETPFGQYQQSLGLYRGPVGHYQDSIEQYQEPPPQYEDPLGQYELTPVDEWVDFMPELVDWEGTLELGINASYGNAESLSIRAGGDLKRETDRSIWEIDLSYAKTTADSIETQHNALFNAKYEHLFQTPWTLFMRFGSEYDEFKAFDIRLSLNTGIGYRFIDNESTKFTTRAGAGVSREYGGPTDDYVPEATFGLDFEQRITERQKFVTVVDYYPDWRDFTDYRLVTDVGWEVLLDEAAHLSLKLSLLDRYDSTPNGREPNDVDYAVLLLWKL